MENIIEIKDVSYRYEEKSTDALKHVSLNVEKGDFLAILGHNGSGKSTLGKLMNALFTPSEGKVYVDGMDTSDENNTYAIRKTCGMVFQNPDNQLVATIVEEDVAFGLENIGVPTEEIRRRVDEALRLVGMEGAHDKAPHMLSGGQKQRIAIAGVVAMRSDVIVFDEATAMLDPVGRRDIMRLVNRLNRDEGKTIVYITHFMDEAAQAKRIAVMDHGSIAISGTPREVFSNVQSMLDMGLDVPDMTRLAYDIDQAGYDLPLDVFDVCGMAEEICRLKSKT